MAFDNTNPTQLQQLYDEWNLDPAGVGYATANNTTQLLVLTNEPENNPGGETQSRPFALDSMMDALDPVDYNANQMINGGPEYINSLILFGTQFGDIGPYEAKFRSVFAGIPGADTITALDAQTVALSRADVLWGYETNITRNDYIAMLEIIGNPL